MRCKTVLSSGILLGLGLSLAGCDSGTGQSKLSGSWYTRELTTRTVYPDGHVETSVDKGTIPLIAINEDGTFDWTDTMLMLFGEDVNHLRNAGDRVTTSEAYVSVVDAEYTPRLSEIELEFAGPGQKDPIRARYRVHLDLFGTVHFSATQNGACSPSFTDRVRGTMTGRLYRSEPAPTSAPG